MNIRAISPCGWGLGTRLYSTHNYCHTGSMTTVASSLILADTLHNLLLNTPSPLMQLNELLTMFSLQVAGKRNPSHYFEHMCEVRGIHVLLRKRDEKEEAKSNKQTRQSNAAHPRQSLSLRKTCITELTRYLRHGSTTKSCT